MEFSLCFFIICITFGAEAYLSNIQKPDDCTSYYDTSSELQTCENGLTWNCATNNCTNNIFLPCCVLDPNVRQYSTSNECSTEGQRVPDQTSCGSYFKCVDGIMIAKKCRETKVFDAELQKCRYGDRSKCTQNVLALDKDTQKETDVKEKVKEQIVMFNNAKIIALVRNTDIDVVKNTCLHCGKKLKSLISKPEDSKTENESSGLFKNMRMFRKKRQVADPLAKWDPKDQSKEEGKHKSGKQRRKRQVDLRNLLLLQNNQNSEPRRESQPSSNRGIWAFYIIKFPLKRRNDDDDPEKAASEVDNNSDSRTQNFPEDNDLFKKSKTTEDKIEKQKAPSKSDQMFFDKLDVKEEKLQTSHKHISPVEDIFSQYKIKISLKNEFISNKQPADTESKNSNKKNKQFSSINGLDTFDGDEITSKSKTSEDDTKRPLKMDELLAGTPSSGEDALGKENSDSNGYNAPKSPYDTESENPSSSEENLLAQSKVQVPLESNVLLGGTRDPDGTDDPEKSWYSRNTDNKISSGKNIRGFKIKIPLKNEDSVGDNTQELTSNDSLEKENLSLGPADASEKSENSERVNKEFTSTPQSKIEGIIVQIPLKKVEPSNSQDSDDDDAQESTTSNHFKYRKLLRRKRQNIARVPNLIIKPCAACMSKTAAPSKSGLRKKRQLFKKAFDKFKKKVGKKNSEADYENETSESNDYYVDNPEKETTVAQ